MRVRHAATLVLVVGFLAGCAATVPPAGVDPTGFASGAPSSVACPSLDGVDLPPECVPYDPDAAMAQNDSFRQRLELSEASIAENTTAAGPVRDALELLRSGGAISEDTVSAALADVGFSYPQIRESYGNILFGVDGPGGGCIFGQISDSEVVVDVGGYIRDGGCLPMQ